VLVNTGHVNRYLIQDQT